MNLLNTSESKLFIIFTERERERDRDRDREGERERESPKSSRKGEGQVVRWCWVNLQCRGVLLILIIVRQGPIALVVGADGGCLDIFSLVYLFSFLSPFLGYGPILTEILLYIYIYFFFKIWFLCEKNS